MKGKEYYLLSKGGCKVVHTKFCSLLHVLSWLIKMRIFLSLSLFNFFSYVYKIVKLRQKIFVILLLL